MVKLGTSQNPTPVTKENIVQVMEDITKVLEERNTPPSDRWIKLSHITKGQWRIFNLANGISFKRVKKLRRMMGSLMKYRGGWK